MTGQAVFIPAPDTPGRRSALWELISPDFLTLVSWDQSQQLLKFPQQHPIMGWRTCTVVGCTEREEARGLCTFCASRWRAVGRPPLEQFRRSKRARQTRARDGKCAVTDCARQLWSNSDRLCRTHQAQRVRLALSAEQFLVHPDVVGLASFGPCQVASCHYQRVGRGPYCHVHDQRWKRLQRSGQAVDIDETQWRRTSSSPRVCGEVSLRGLPDPVVAELLFGLQQRVARCCKTPHHKFRLVCEAARAQLASTLTEIAPDSLANCSRKVLLCFVNSVRLAELNPETERMKDEWNTVVFGHRGVLRFGAISQPWLREATKRWAYHDISTRTGRRVTGACQVYVSSIARLSESMRLQREDGGTDPRRLSATDITAFANRMAFLAAEGAVSDSFRYATLVRVRRTLRTMRALGLARPGEPLHLLPEDFAIAELDLPRASDRDHYDKAGKDLPVEVMRHICAHLDQFEELTNTEFRKAVELIIDTGRRPNEVCGLALDCLVRDGQGKPVLVYDNTKAGRLGRRLPITEATAEVISRQQARVRQLFPCEPGSELKLLPTTQRNPHGRRAIQESALSVRHRDWMAVLPDISPAAAPTVEGIAQPTRAGYDKSKIFLYAYRHTYAQRHADAGVPVDVLRELMDHRQLQTTQGYYRVGERRRREAVERVTTMQFDRHGNRVWRHAQSVLDSEHLRRAVGSVAVPYGTCSEPSNVAAGGTNCPIRFRCVGCAHFSTDISYLPDLEAYLADLLRSRERLRSAAFAAADDWAAADAMPSDEEITRIRRLIARITAGRDELTDQDRQQIDTAVDVVRHARGRIVGLGVPRVGQPLPDTYPHRSA
ncbi:tyrosine-type recombinase/integrase [Nocardia cyriacigeorgica]|uniref:tyrosine-type recombinase/integrase n=1 Tax=Nocardia cyriacigeorgica TaxID=135487 RepID=UPI001E365AED|nr:tyrosine-type recombinase/integrase [Nocardia cyriacigeorgica]